MVRCHDGIVEDGLVKRQSITRVVMELLVHGLQRDDLEEHCRSIPRIPPAEKVLSLAVFLEVGVAPTDDGRRHAVREVHRGSGVRDTALGAHRRIVRLGDPAHPVEPRFDIRRHRGRVVGVIVLLNLAVGVRVEEPRIERHVAHNPGNALFHVGTRRNRVEVMPLLLEPSAHRPVRAGDCARFKEAQVELRGGPRVFLVGVVDAVVRVVRPDEQPVLRRQRDRFGVVFRAVPVVCAEPKTVEPGFGEPFDHFKGESVSPTERVADEIGERGLKQEGACSAVGQVAVGGVGVNIRP